MAATNNTVLIDSNIIIYSAQPEHDMLSTWLKTKNITISIISRIEVFGYSKLLKEDEVYFKAFFSKCQIFKLTEKVILRTISLKQQKKMSLGDAIIAATAIIEKLPLITTNTKDFQHIENLELIDPLTV